MLEEVSHWDQWLLFLVFSGGWNQQFPIGYEKIHKTPWPLFILWGTKDFPNCRFPPEKALKLHWPFLESILGVGVSGFPGSAKRSRFHANVDSQRTGWMDWWHQILFLTSASFWRVWQNFHDLFQSDELRVTWQRQQTMHTKYLRFTPIHTHAQKKENYHSLLSWGQQSFGDRTRQLPGIHSRVHVRINLQYTALDMWYISSTEFTYKWWWFFCQFVCQELNVQMYLKVDALGFCAEQTPLNARTTKEKHSVEHQRNASPYKSRPVHGVFPGKPPWSTSCKIGILFCLK